MGKPTHVQGTRKWFRAALLLLLAACSGSEIEAPATGEIRVSVVTSGDNPDSDGYSIALDSGVPRTLPINGSIVLADVGARAHSLLISGLAQNCTADGDNPMVIDVNEGDTTAVALHVSCRAISANLVVVTSTLGSSLDQDGYDLTLTGSGFRENKRIATNGALDFTLSAGSYTLTLREIDQNCALDGPNPRPVLVRPGVDTVALFLTCATPRYTGSITLSVTVISPQALRSRTVMLDGTRSLVISGPGTYQLADVSDGVHRIQVLGGIYGGPIVCGLWIDDATFDGPVTVSDGGDAEVALVYDCF